MTTVTLPWPPKELSPNARSHWAAKARATAKYRADCSIAMFNERKAIKGRKAFKITFLPPDNRRRDLDNCVGAFKAGQDALAKMVGIDDSHFDVSYSRGDPVKGGAVIVEVTG